MQAGKFNYCLDMVRKGDNSGVKDIYIEYYEPMTFVALKYVKNLATASDIASDFIKYLLEQAKNIPYVDSPSAWIYTSIKNRSIDYIRKNSKEVCLLDMESYKASDTQNDLYIEFTNCFEKMKDSHQELVLLHYIYGFKYKEISKMIGKPIGTIKWEISEIKRELSHLKKYR